MEPITAAAIIAAISTGVTAGATDVVENELKRKRSTPSTEGDSATTRSVVT